MTPGSVLRAPDLDLSKLSLIAMRTIRGRAARRRCERRCTQWSAAWLSLPRRLFFPVTWVWWYQEDECRGYQQIAAHYRILYRFRLPNLRNCRMKHSAVSEASSFGC